MSDIKVSSYFSEYKFKIDLASVTRVKEQAKKLKTLFDKELAIKVKLSNTHVTKINEQIKKIKERVEKGAVFNLKIGNVKINKSTLSKALNTAANSSPRPLTLSINSFKINAAALRRAVRDAYNSGGGLNLIPPNTRTPQEREAARLERLERMRLSQERLRQSAERLRLRTEGGSGGGGGNRRTFRNDFPYENGRFTGGYGGIAAVAGAGYGIMALNQRSEDLQSSKVALDTLTKGRGADAFQWFKNTANSQGFDYAKQLPVFQNYLGASINKQGYENSLKSFNDISQYGLTRGADTLSLERAMLAIGQMWSKGKINAEEVEFSLAA